MFTGHKLRRKANAEALYGVTATSTTWSAATSSQSVGTLSLGEPHANRKLIICVGGNTGTKSGNPVPTTLTVGGSSATLVVSKASTFNTAGCAVFIIDYTTGSSADIIVTWSAAVNYCCVSVIRAVGLSSSTPVATETRAEYSGNAHTLTGSIAANPTIHAVASGGYGSYATNTLSPGTIDVQGNSCCGGSHLDEDGGAYSIDYTKSSNDFTLAHAAFQ